MGQIRDALMNILNGKKYTLPKIFVAKKLYSIIIEKNVEAAVHFYNSLKIKNDTNYDLSESELNLLGYQFLSENKINSAITVLKLNVEAYPGSSNVYESLGEAYMKNNDKESAVRNFSKSLKIDPLNQDARNILTKLNVK